MFELEYMKVYTGAALNNALKYGDQRNEIVRALANRFEFRARVNKPTRPAKWAGRNAWNDYRFKEERYLRYSQSVANSDKYVLDSNANYIITRNKGIVWLNYRSKKTVSMYSSDLLREPWKFVGYTIQETGLLLVLNNGRMYAVNMTTQEILPWSDREDGQ